MATKPWSSTAPAGEFRPFVDAGMAFDTLSGLKQTITQTVLPAVTTTSTTSNPAELKNTTTKGFVLGGGLDLHVLILHISPEIRFTHWGSPHFNDPNGLIKSKQNQAEFLVGFTF